MNTLQNEPIQETETNGKHLIGKLSIEAKLLIDLLRETEQGQFVSYAALSEVIGRNVQKEGNGALQTARRRLLKDHQVLIGTVRDEGVKNMTDTERVEHGQYDLDHVRRHTRRSYERITSVKDFDGLPNDAKIQHNARAAMFGTMAYLAHGNRVKKLEAKVAEAGTALPVQKTLEAFRDQAS